VFVLAASKVVSGVSWNQRACTVLPGAFSRGKWGGERRAEGGLPAPEHRACHLVPSTSRYKEEEDGVRLERGLRVGKVEDICWGGLLGFFKVKRDSGGFQVGSSCELATWWLEDLFHLEIKEETDFGQACI